MVNYQIERINMADVFQARYVLQRPDDHRIARDAVEPHNRARHEADSFLAFRTQEEAEVYRQAMRADTFEVVELPPEVWLEACRGFMREGLTYLSLPELHGGIVVKKSVRLADILAAFQQLSHGQDHGFNGYRWN